MTPAEARACALERRGRGAARRALRAAAAQRSRPRPGAAAGADDRRPGGCRGDRRRSRWPRRCSCGGGTVVEPQRLSRVPAPLLAAGRCSGPTSSGLATGEAGSRSPELLRLSQRGPGRGRGAEGRRGSCWRGSRRLGERQLDEELAPARCWACCRHGDLYPAVAARRRRRALGADRPRRPRPARRPGAVRRGDDRRRPPRHLLRPRGRPRAGAGAGRRRDDRGQRPRLRDRRLRPPRRPRRGGRTIAVLGCGPDVAYPAAHRSLWRRICEAGPGALRAPARRDALALDLPGPQPDHGGACRG